ncbi:MAG: secretin and TonB N-terminal domain-containing protein, partial [Bacteroidota bacterium]
MSDPGVKIFLFFFILHAVAGSLSGQEGGRTPITLDADEVALEEVLEQIESQSGLHFAYSSRLLDERKPVTIHVKEAPLEEVLGKLFRDQGIRFEIIERQIVLKKMKRAGDSPGFARGADREEGLRSRLTLSGYVRDALSGEVLIGATISVADGMEGTITNSYGFYSLTVGREVTEISCSYIGYRRMTVPVEGDSSRVTHFALQREPEPLHEVTIYSHENDNIIRTMRSSQESIHPKSVRRMPALFGEKDVIKSLACIPGIRFFGDGSTIFYVRGGARDQNMITIDEAPVYNPTHLLGFFSTVVPDAIKDVKVYKGDFPARYGGRLSSLVDIRTRDGNMNRFGLDGSVGLLSSRLSLEGPLWKEHISFFASGRRSYITRPLQLLNPRISDLHFSDLHVKLNYRINARNRVFLSLYRGVDNFEQRSAGEQTSGVNWQNSATTLRWNHLFSDRLFSNLTLLGSRYDYYLNTHIEN